MSTDNKYYVYIHRKLATGLPFYVGKGSRTRCFSTYGRNSYWHRTVNKYGFSIEILIENVDEQTAFDFEKYYIQILTHYGIKLTNMSSGGEGNSGFSFSDSDRIKISKSLSLIRNKKKVKKEIIRPSAFGYNNHFADKNNYYFTNMETGLVVFCNRHYLCETFGLSKNNIKKLFYTKSRKSTEGWRLSTPEEKFEYERKKQTTEG